MHGSGQDSELISYLRPRKDGPTWAPGVKGTCNPDNLKPIFKD